jgi:hypothetical protein
VSVRGEQSHGGLSGGNIQLSFLEEIGYMRQVRVQSLHRDIGVWIRCVGRHVICIAYNAIGGFGDVSDVKIG